jgi:hypothetical protein
LGIEKLEGGLIHLSPVLLFKHTQMKFHFRNQCTIECCNSRRIFKTWCILINSVFMKFPIYPTTEEFNSVCPEKLKKNVFMLCRSRNQYIKYSSRGSRSRLRP